MAGLDPEGKDRPLEQGRERRVAAEPPVVARLVLELRADGTRTVARGMAEDLARGERVTVAAEGRSPLELALSLLRSLLQVPAIGRGLSRGLLAAGRKRHKR